jgi:hypothetical protein
MDSYRLGYSNGLAPTTYWIGNSNGLVIRPQLQISLPNVDLNLWHVRSQDAILDGILLLNQWRLGEDQSNSRNCPPLLY